VTMTLEIKQLILRAVVEERRDRPLAAGDRGSRTASAAAFEKGASWLTSSSMC